MSTATHAHTQPIAIISQQMLREVKSLRDERLELERWAREIEVREKDLMHGILSTISEGASVEAGPRILVEKSLGKRPDWHEEFVKANGTAAAQAVIAATNPKTTWVVEESAAPTIDRDELVAAVIATEEDK